MLALLIVVGVIVGVVVALLERRRVPKIRDPRMLAGR